MTFFSINNEFFFIRNAVNLHLGRYKVLVWPTVLTAHSVQPCPPPETNWPSSDVIRLFFGPQSPARCSPSRMKSNGTEKHLCRHLFLTVDKQNNETYNLHLLLN